VRKNSTTKQQKTPSHTTQGGKKLNQKKPQQLKNQTQIAGQQQHRCKETGQQ